MRRLSWLPLTIAICCIVEATALDPDPTRLRSLKGRQLQHEVATESRLLPTGHGLNLRQQQRNLQLRRSTSAANATQRLASQVTPGTRLSRVVPDEWKPAVTWFFTIVLFAFFYKRLAFYVPDLDPAKVNDTTLSFKGWRHELFDCGNASLFCLMSLVFPSLGLADNLTKTRSGAFFATVIASAFLIAMNFMVLVLPWCAFAVYCTYHRQQLRDAFEMEPDDNSMYTDCLLYLFCNPCTLTQDARHIREAAQAGHPAVERERHRLRMYF